MCGPYAANYDGNEMNEFPMHDERAISECGTFNWDHDLVTNEFAGGCTELCTCTTAQKQQLREQQNSSTVTLPWSIEFDITRHWE